MYDEYLIWLVFLGFVMSGMIIGGSIGYALGRRDERRNFGIVWGNVKHIHKSLGHKSFMVIHPRVGERQKNSRI